MAAQVVVFDILGLIAVAAALGVVLARNPVHSAVALVLTFVNVAGIYVVLRAEFLAAVQVIVYTGAILVLVLFVIMLVHLEDLPEFHGGQPVQRVFGFLLGLVLLAEVAAAIVTRTALGQIGPWSPQQVAAVGGNVQAIGQVLYSGYVLPIQATALVLLVATIGALTLARPDVPKAGVGMARHVLTISLAHPRGENEEEGYRIPELPPGTVIKPEAGDRELVMAKSGDEFVDAPAWGEHRNK